MEEQIEETPAQPEPQQSESRPTGSQEDAQVTQKTQTEQKNQEDWKRKYSGLQGAYSKLRSEFSELQQMLDEKTNTHETEAAELRAELDRLSSERNAFEQAVRKMEDELNGLKRRNEIRQVIASDNEISDLLPLYEGGFINGVESLEGDDLLEYLRNYKNAIDGIKREAIDETLSGATPDTQNNKEQAGMTADKLYEALMNADPNSDEYQNLFEAYFKATSNNNH
ncbi:MAG: hypothetical protein CUN55_00500 [Phototrophicales bacterium]|nr:MAG: hypothetical protein CUN55_00500 [Phototrophicales bacterium]